MAVYDYCIGFVFFFKQKTAYEMRISDWSSDVCSSDLLPGRKPHAPEIPPEGRVDQVHAMVRDIAPFGRGDGAAGQLPVHRVQHHEDEAGEHAGPIKPPERKSVVKGKSVSVRVDLGRRRTLKTQKTASPKHKHQR